MKTLTIDEEWKTVTYPKKKWKSAQIVEYDYDGDSSVYFMEEVDGYALFQFTKPQKIQALEINGKTVMVDDPLHWIGMQRLAENATGRVAVAGLGMGLILHHLVKNDKVTQIDVIEINPDVITLMHHSLPKDNRITIYKGNALTWHYDNYETIILDLIVTGKTDFPNINKIMGFVQMLEIRQRANAYRIPEQKIFVWGVRDMKYNPAVKHIPNFDYVKFQEQIRAVM